jgi:hypothetical protein
MAGCCRPSGECGYTLPPGPFSSVLPAGSSLPDIGCFPQQDLHVAGITAPPIASCAQWTAPLPSGGVCPSGAKQCTSSTAIETCNASGHWGTPVSCTNKACVKGACVGVCSPGSTQCSAGYFLTCTASGSWNSGNYCGSCGCGGSGCGGCPSDAGVKG